jgi:hypothetical protein
VPAAPFSKIVYSQQQFYNLTQERGARVATKGARAKEPLRVLKLKGSYCRLDFEG